MSCSAELGMKKVLWPQGQVYNIHKKDALPISNSKCPALPAISAAVWSVPSESTYINSTLVG